MRAAVSWQRWVLVLTVGVLLSPIQPAQADSENINKRLLLSTGWINCPQPNGATSWGTCWVYDRQQRLVITNKHVVEHAAKVMVDFPVRRDGQLLTQVTEYLQMAPIHGRVLACDEKRDLALCQLERLPADVIAIPLANQAATRGNKVFSLGNSSANTPKKEEARLWRFVSGKVEMRYFDTLVFRKPVQKIEATSLRASLKTAPGDSGGPVVNTSCELVGVHSNADTFNSFGIDVNEVRVFMGRALATRRLPANMRDLAGTWTVATTDELGRCYWSLTVRGDGSCQFEREDCFDGSFLCIRDGKARVAIPSLQMRGEVTLNWADDQQFSFNLNGLQYTATRR